MKEWIFYSVQYTSYQRIWIDISVQCVYGNCSLGVIRYHFGWHSLPHLGLNSHHEVTKAHFHSSRKYSISISSFERAKPKNRKPLFCHCCQVLPRSFRNLMKKFSYFERKKSTTCLLWCIILELFIVLTWCIGMLSLLCYGIMHGSVILHPRYMMHFSVIVHFNDSVHCSWSVDYSDIVHWCTFFRHCALFRYRSMLLLK